MYEKDMEGIDSIRVDEQGNFLLGQVLSNYFPNFARDWETHLHFN